MTRPSPKRQRLQQNEAAVNVTASSFSRRVLQTLDSMDWKPLIEQVSFEEPDWSEEKSGKAVEEYKHFLALKVAHSDFDHNLLSPGPIIDKVWHMHLLDTKSYLRCCEAICSIRAIDAHFIHHNPASARDPVEQRVERYGRTLSEYRLCFRKDPTLWCLPPVEQLFPSSAPTALPASDVKSEPGDVHHTLSTGNSPTSTESHITLCLRSSAGDATWFRVPRTIPMQRVLSVYAMRLGFDARRVRLMFGPQDACQCGSTPNSLGIEDGDELHVLSKQTGC